MQECIRPGVPGFRKFQSGLVNSTALNCLERRPSLTPSIVSDATMYLSLDHLGHFEKPGTRQRRISESQYIAKRGALLIGPQGR